MSSTSSPGPSWPEKGARLFLTLMVIGLVGLVMMAIPAFGRHAGSTAGHAGALGHGAHGGHALGSGHGGHAHAPLPTHAAAHSQANAPGAGQEMVPADTSAASGVLRRLPSPRSVFSVLALYGAFGNALVDAAHLPLLVAALVAVVPTLLVERFAVTPLWNLLFRFQGQPSAPLEELILADATAVTPFRNGRGLVSVVRDGRRVQFAAHLREDEARLPVKVGERLRVEDVDARQERLTVSVLRDTPSVTMGGPRPPQTPQS